MFHQCLEYYRGKAVLITGGTGYLGSKFVKELNSIDCEVSLLVRKDRDMSEAWMKNLNFKIFEGNILDKSLLKEALKDKDFLFHFAARDNKFGLKLMPQEDLEMNLIPVLKILEVCRENSYVTKILFAGSENQLGAADEIPVNEDFKDKPLTIFGINKLFAEKYLEFYKHNFGIQSVTLRLSNIYGPTARVESATQVALNKIIHDALKGSINVFSSGDFIRDFIYIDDVIKAFLLAGKEIEELDRPFYYIGSGSGNNFMDAIELVAVIVDKKTGCKPKIIKSIPNAKLSDFDKRSFIADSNLFYQSTGWSAKVSIAAGIEKTIEYFLSL